MKFKDIQIQGIQSHKDTRLELSPGTNVIIGDSSVGKSAVVKSLYWLTFNRPNRVDILSRDGTREARVAITQTDDPETAVTRRKTKTRNQYHTSNYMTEKVYDSVGTDVPADVAERLGLCEMNFHRQRDPIFFLTKTPGDRARTLNDQIADLWLIDAMVSDLTGEMREVERDEERCAGQASECEADAAQFDWVPDIQGRISKIEWAHKGLTESENTLAGLLKAYHGAADIVSRMPDRAAIRQAQESVTALDKTRQGLERQAKWLADVRAALEEAQNLKAAMAERVRYTKAWKDYLEDLKDRAGEIKQQQEKWHRLKQRLKEASRMKEDLDDRRQQAAQARKQFNEEFPDTCPLCGADWSKA